MKRITAREIALSGIAAAFAVIAVVLSRFVAVMTLTFLALSSVALTLPLMRDSVRGAVFAYLATVGLGFLFVQYIGVMPFVIIFGPYPILNYYLRKYLKKRWIILPIEIAFANLSFLACYYAIGLTLADFPIVDSLPDWGKYLLIYGTLTLIFIVFHFAFCALYDFLKQRLSKVINE